MPRTSNLSKHASTRSRASVARSSSPLQRVTRSMTATSSRSRVPSSTTRKPYTPIARAQTPVPRMARNQYPGIKRALTPAPRTQTSSMPRRRPSTARSPVAIAHPKRTTRRLTTAGRVGATIGTIPHLVPVTPGKDCVVSGSGTAKGKQLGCGDQACVYELKNRLTVVKITPLITDAVEARWVREFNSQSNLATTRSAPLFAKDTHATDKGILKWTE